QVEEEWASMGAGSDLPDTELARIRAAFTPVEFETLPPRSEIFEAERASNRAFARWARNNLQPHKKSGYSIVEVSLKEIGETPGDCSAEQMELLAELGERYSLDDVRVNYEQNLVLPHVKQDDLPEVWRRLDAAGLATPNINLISDIIACPGLDY